MVRWNTFRRLILQSHMSTWLLTCTFMLNIPTCTESHLVSLFWPSLGTLVRAWNAHWNIPVLFPCVDLAFTHLECYILYFILYKYTKGALCFQENFTKVTMDKLACEVTGFTCYPTSWWEEEDSSCKKEAGMASSALRTTSLLAGSRSSDWSSRRQWTLFETHVSSERSEWERWKNNIFCLA